MHRERLEWMFNGLGHSKVKTRLSEEQCQQPCESEFIMKWNCTGASQEYFSETISLFQSKQPQTKILKFFVTQGWDVYNTLA